MGRKVKKYILFTGKEHDGIRFDYTEAMIDRFIEVWGNGAPAAEISKKLNVSMVSVALLVMDLEMAGRIKTRDGGLLGNKRAVS
ncbi:MAG: hypothetical protein RR595_16320 [Lysinibacillus sp.]